MRRILRILSVVIGWLFVAVPLGGLALGTGAGAGPAAASTSTSSNSTGVQDFTFDSFSAEYFLGRDAEGHSTLRTVETFVARFPGFDQNRGIIRAIPNDYDGIPLRTSVQSVVDENGAPVHFEATDTSGFTELALGTDDFVHGKTTYTISYTQQNVVRAFMDTNDDEFYWDTNGTGFAQPFGSVTARVHVDPSLTGFLTGNNVCYQGAQGTDGSCEIVHTPDAAGDTFTATAKNLGPGENLTIVVGFTLGTFVQVPPEERPSSPGVIGALGPSPWWLDAASIGSVILILLGTAFTIVWRFVKPAASRGSGIIIPQYTPPKDLNLLESSNLIGRTGSGLPAQIVSLAVRGKLRILDYPVTNSGAKFTLQLLDSTGVDAQEKALLTALFFGDVGAVREIGTVNDVMASAIGQVQKYVRNGLFARGLLQRRSPLAGILIAVAIIFVFSFVTMGLFVVSTMFGAINLWGIGGFILSIFAGFLCAGFAWRPAVPTAAGAEYRDYLLGMRDYLQLAEADRFRMLQSPEGAERVRVEGVNPAIPAEKVKLYEKLLPFAVLWGVEKEWAKELTVSYGTTAPEWFVSSRAFDAMSFSSTLGSIAATTVARATYRSSSGSSWSRSSGGSFSGGSHGGGFSGGGGGGGGGGGR